MTRRKVPFALPALSAVQPMCSLRLFSSFFGLSLFKAHPVLINDQAVSRVQVSQANACEQHFPAKQPRWLSIRMAWL